MPRLCWMVMPVGQRATWVIFGILETYNEPRQLYVYISGITGRSCSIRFQRGTICLGFAMMMMPWGQGETWVIFGILDKWG